MIWLVVSMLVHQMMSTSFLVVKNYGVSFGYSGIFLILLSMVIVFLLGWIGIKNGGGLILIFVGGLVNLIDRMIFGYVRDYWNFLGSGIYNNFNDWIIGIGVFIYLFETLWKKSK